MEKSNKIFLKFAVNIKTQTKNHVSDHRLWNTSQEKKNINKEIHFFIQLYEICI